MQWFLDAQHKAWENNYKWIFQLKQHSSTLSCTSSPCSLTAEEICQEVHLLQLPACLYSRHSTALTSYSVFLESINRDLSKKRKQLLLKQAGHLAAGFADCLYTFFSQLLLGKPAQIMNYRRLNTHSLGWQERVCTHTYMRPSHSSRTIC